MASHPDCKDPTCPYRAEIEDVRRLVGEMYGRLNRLAEGTNQPKPEKAEAHMIEPPDGYQFTAAEWREALKGTTGTLEERVAQALRAADRQRSV